MARRVSWVIISGPLVGSAANPIRVVGASHTHRDYGATRARLPPGGVANPWQFPGPYNIGVPRNEGATPRMQARMETSTEQR